MNTWTKLGAIGGLLFAAASANATAIVGETASATPVARLGAGHSVTHQDAFAGFESQAALSGDYTENGLYFPKSSYAGVFPSTNSNNDCGYAGCSRQSDFSGNFMYSRPYNDFNEFGRYENHYFNRFFEIKSTDGNLFKAIELNWQAFLTYSYSADNQGWAWYTYRSGNLTGSGTLSVPAVRTKDSGDRNVKSHVVGVTDLAGFDTLKFSSTPDYIDYYSFRAPGFDSVRAQYTTGSPDHTYTARDIPEPRNTAGLFLLGLGMLGGGCYLRKKRMA